MKTTTHFYKSVSLGYSLASVLSFLSWVLSKRDILPQEAKFRWAMDLPSVAKAGFPIQAFELPQPPLGGDYVPHEMMRGLIFNELFWLVVGTIIAFVIFRRCVTTLEKYKTSTLLIPGVFFLFLHWMLFALWFD